MLPSLHCGDSLWRGSLLPLACAAGPLHFFRTDRIARFTTAAQPSGSKLPRHKSTRPRNFRSVRLIPVIAHTYFHQQRHVQRGGGAHVLADFPAHLIDQVFAHFQDQFVVNLQDHLRIQP